MPGQSRLAEQSIGHLAASSEIRDDVCELPRLGDIMKFRGVLYVIFAHGATRNPNDQDLMLQKLRQYVGSGEMRARR